MHPTSVFFFLATLPMVTSLGFLGVGCGVQAPGFQPVIGTSNGDLTSFYKVADKNAWPWMVFLAIELPDGSHTTCGAGLLRVKNVDESDILVTPAHCVATAESSDTEDPQARHYNQLLATVGAHDVLDAVNNRAFIPVAGVVLHPEYKLSKHNDIALVKLLRPVNFTETVRPICLPKYGEELPAGKPCAVASWSRKNGTLDETSNVLKQLTVPVHNGDTCAKNDNGGWGADYVENEMVCAGELKTPDALGDDICQGEDGGLLTCEQSGKFTLYGALSFNYKNQCHKDGYPKVYSRVSSYVKWIKKEMRKLTSVIGINDLNLEQLAEELRPHVRQLPPVIAMSK